MGGCEQKYSLILDGLNIIGTFYDMGLCCANLGKYENVIEFCIIVLTKGD
jgi:hypothetical protein